MDFWLYIYYLFCVFAFIYLYIYDCNIVFNFTKGAFVIIDIVKDAIYKLCTFYKPDATCYGRYSESLQRTMNFWLFIYYLFCVFVLIHLLYIHGYNTVFNYCKLLFAIIGVVKVVYDEVCMFYNPEGIYYGPDSESSPWTMDYGRLICYCFYFVIFISFHHIHGHTVVANWCMVIFFLIGVYQYIVILHSFCKSEASQQNSESSQWSTSFWCIILGLFNLFLWIYAISIYSYVVIFYCHIIIVAYLGVSESIPVHVRKYVQLVAQVLKCGAIALMCVYFLVDLIIPNTTVTDDTTVYNDELPKMSLESIYRSRMYLNRFYRHQEVYSL